MRERPFFAKASKGILLRAFEELKSCEAPWREAGWCDVWDSNPCCCAENADAWPLAERRVSGSGRRIRTCRILINSQAHPPRTVDRNEVACQP